jgi:hypothetical protein
MHIHTCGYGKSRDAWATTPLHHGFSALSQQPGGKLRIFSGGGRRLRNYFCSGLFEEAGNFQGV